MNAKRSGLDYLRDILEMMEKIEAFIRGMDFDEFERDEKTNFAVFRALEVIGEASKHIPESVKRRHPEIPWKRMAGMRDRLIHGYFGVDLEIVWKTATQLIPELRSKLREVLKAEEAYESKER
ncbi:HepT-like ribonuclease domain-containing protein [Candidatus Bipolaricaulota sp. J31]